MNKISRHKKQKRILPVAIAFATVAIVVSSCDGDKKEFINVQVDYETTPTMKTTDVETVISDSGIVRYKITAPTWLVFDEAQEPRWNFSQSLHMDKYDNNMKEDASFDCDSAEYLSKKRLWRFDGHVVAVNVAGDRFATNQLFWDQQKKKVYTDSFIHIERSDRVIEGYGFVSNENMTEYNVNRVAGIFPVSDMRHEDEDSVETVNPLDTLPDRPTSSQAKKAERPGRRVAKGLQRQSVSPVEAVEESATEKIINRKQNISE